MSLQWLVHGWRVMMGALSLTVLLGLTDALAQDGLLLTPGERQGIGYVSGGVGLDERRYLDTRLGIDYNLKLEFALRDGRYLGDVAVEILGADGGPLVSLHSPGPWLLLRLPEGRYRIRARTLSRSFEQSINLESDTTGTLIFNGWRDTPVP
ncbi:hypothetical protein [Marichromatium sp. PS1]|uniref:hypothetical protein n=1 Tax=Marichromatium sp. PS1 TaxID=3138932 RepID=UPI0034E8DDFC